MKCYYHPAVEAVATCSNCGRAICEQCSVDVSGKVMCRECISNSQANQGRTPDPLAIISLVLGVLGVLALCCGGPIGGIPVGGAAAVTGWIAKNRVLKKDDPGQYGKEFALAGLILGAVEVGFGLVFLLITGVALTIPVLLEMAQ